MLRSTERGIAVASCPSACLTVCLPVHLSVTLRYRGHIGWNSWKIISRLISLTFLLSAECRPQHHEFTPKGTSQILGGIGVGYGKNGSDHTKPTTSPKRLKIERKLLLTAYIKSYTGFRLPPKCMTLNNL